MSRTITDNIDNLSDKESSHRRNEPLKQTKNGEGRGTSGEQTEVTNTMTFDSNIIEQSNVTKGQCVERTPEVLPRTLAAISPVTGDTIKTTKPN